MFNVLVKPIGAKCNLACDYCFYLDKSKFYPETNNFRMNYEVLEHFISQYIASQSGPVINFLWQGGEPTLLGLEFFEKVVTLQEKYLPQGWRAENGIQTNGTLLDDNWCQFFREHNFLVGVSLDGPANFHDFYRKDKLGNSSHAQVLRGIKLLQQNGVAYNILCAVNAGNVGEPLQVYQFFRKHGVEFIQFIPIVEWQSEGVISERSITGQEYGRFLTTIFDYWLLHDFNTVSIQIFEECYAIINGFGGRLCVNSQVCGQSLVLEHNGDLYACDHFVTEDHFLGNIVDQGLIELAQDTRMKKFGNEKYSKLATQCSDCPVLFICHGGCPKDRVQGLNHLCAGYRQFFSYCQPYLQLLGSLITTNTGLEQINTEMTTLHQQRWAKLGRNDLCSCQSGEKYKKCCLERIAQTSFN